MEGQAECVICMHNLRLQVNEMMEEVPDRYISTYMKTPCNHKFHEICLRNWMRIKLECPVCREPLPPYEQD